MGLVVAGVRGGAGSRGCGMGHEGGARGGTGGGARVAGAGWGRGEGTAERGAGAEAEAEGVLVGWKRRTWRWGQTDTRQEKEFGGQGG